MRCGIADCRWLVWATVQLLGLSLLDSSTFSIAHFGLWSAGILIAGQPSSDCSARTWPCADEHGPFCAPDDAADACTARHVCPGSASQECPAAPARR